MTLVYNNVEHQIHTFEKLETDEVNLCLID